MKDPANGAFVLLSESCVPIKPFGLLMDHFERSGWRGIFRMKSHAETALHDIAKGRRLEKVPDIPPSLWKFHSQWIVLNRDMASVILSSDLTFNWEASFAADESLPATQLALAGYPLADRVVPMDATWTRWTGDWSGHPLTIGKLTEELFCTLLAAPQFFARKFSARSDIRAFGLHLPLRKPTGL